MTRLRYNGLSATLGDALTSSSTAITGSDYIPLSILDPNGNESEVVWLTAYTQGQTTGTISRGKEGTTRVTHASGDRIVHGPTVADLAANESTAGMLVDATTPGDAGGRSDHFLGSALSGWTVFNVSGALTPILGNSVVNLSSSGVGYIYKPFTPSGAFAVEARLAVNPGVSGDVGLYVTDYEGAGSPATNGNAVAAALFWNSSVSKFQMDATRIAGGARTTLGTFDIPAATWIYLRVTRSAAGVVEAFYSFDRTRWVSFGGAPTLSFTPTRVLLTVGSVNGASADLLDVVA